MTRTHCKNGHDLFASGTYRDGKHGWRCAQCTKENDERRRERLREQKARAIAAGATIEPYRPEPTGDPSGALDLFRKAEDAMPWERDALKAKARRLAHGGAA